MDEVHRCSIKGCTFPVTYLDLCNYHANGGVYNFTPASAHKEHQASSSSFSHPKERVMGQIALALMLTAGAALLIQTIRPRQAL
jgi:hypothetical protein